MSCFTSIFFNQNPHCFAIYPEDQKMLPAAFMYQGKPIEDGCMKELLFFSDEEGQIDLLQWNAKEKHVMKKEDESDFEDGFEWDYIVKLANGFHVVRGYLWPAGAMGKFSNLCIIQRKGDILKISEMILGGDRHASMIFDAQIANDKIIYSQGETSMGFMERVMQLFPDVKILYERSSKNGLGYGEACFVGVWKFAATVSDQGRVINKEIITFMPAGGGDEQFEKKDLKKIALEMLVEIDEEKVLFK